MDGLFTIVNHSIKVKMNEPFYIVPIGDIHYGAPNHASYEFDKFLEWGRANKNRCWFLGMGDYVDLMAMKERMSLRSGKFHESTMEWLEDGARAITNELADKLSFMKGRTIGLLEGNHRFDFGDGTTSTMRLCQKLDTKYLGGIAIVRLAMSDQTSRLSLDLCCHHGKGAARLIGGSVNRVQQMAEGIEADIYLMGHDHKRQAAPDVRLKLDQHSSLKERKIYYVRTGGFLKGYVPGKASYVAREAKKPVDLGYIRIEVVPRRDRSRERKGLYADMAAIV